MTSKEHSHPQPLEYVKIAAILAVITAIEVAVIYTPIRDVMALLLPVLFVLSAFKFALVALWFMHLKFDNRLFSWLFFGGMCLTVLMILALLVLMISR